MYMCGRKTNPKRRRIMLQLAPVQSGQKGKRNSIPTLGGPLVGNNTYMDPYHGIEAHTGTSTGACRLAAAVSSIQYPEKPNASTLLEATWTLRFFGTSSIWRFLPPPVRNMEYGVRSTLILILAPHPRQFSISSRTVVGIVFLLLLPLGTHTCTCMLRRQITSRFASCVRDG